MCKPSKKLENLNVFKNYASSIGFSSPKLLFFIGKGLIRTTFYHVFVTISKLLNETFFGVHFISSKLHNIIKRNHYLWKL